MTACCLGGIMLTSPNYSTLEGPPPYYQECKQWLISFNALKTVSRKILPVCHSRLIFQHHQLVDVTYHRHLPRYHPQRRFDVVSTHPQIVAS